MNIGLWDGEVKGENKVSGVLIFKELNSSACSV